MLLRLRNRSHSCSVVNCLCSVIVVALPEQSLTMRPLISGLMVYSQSLFDRFLDNGLIFVGRPRRMPKKVGSLLPFFVGNQRSLLISSPFSFQSTLLLTNTSICYKSYDLHHTSFLEFPFSWGSHEQCDQASGTCGRWAPQGSREQCDQAFRSCGTQPRWGTRGQCVRAFRSCGTRCSRCGDASQHWGSHEPCGRPVRSCSTWAVSPSSQRALLPQLPTPPLLLGQSRALWPVSPQL